MTTRLRVMPAMRKGLAFVLKDFKNQDYQIIKLASPVRFAARLAGV